MLAACPGFERIQRLEHRLLHPGVRRLLRIAGGKGFLHGVGGTRRQQTVEVQRAAGFRAGARQTFATKRLHTHYGANDVAVDVHVAGVDVVDHLGDGLVDARVHA